MKEKHFLQFDRSVILILSSPDSSLHHVHEFPFFPARLLFRRASGIGLVKGTIFAALESRWNKILLLSTDDFTAREVAGNNLRVLFFPSDYLGKLPGLFVTLKGRPLICNWTVHKWMTAYPPELKAAWRITKSRAAKYLLLWLFKKRISGLLPLIMLFQFGSVYRLAMIYIIYRLSWFETYLFHFPTSCFEQKCFNFHSKNFEMLIISS